MTDTDKLKNQIAQNVAVQSKLAKLQEQIEEILATLKRIEQNQSTILAALPD